MSIMDMSLNSSKRTLFETFVLYLEQRQMKLLELALNSPTRWGLCQDCHGG